MDHLLHIDQDFDYLTTFLPEGWQCKAKELGALRRCRKIPSAEVLLRILLLHLAEGCSLRETSTRLAIGGVASVSDVTIMDRLRISAKWLSWMCMEMSKIWLVDPPRSWRVADRRIRLVDGTRVKEPGPTGSAWCVHYSIELATMASCEMIVQDSRGNGETFKKFTIQPRDLMVGDRAYGVPPGLAHVCDQGGDVLVRFAWNLLPLWTDERKRFDLLGHLRTLEGTRVGDWEVIVKVGKKRYRGRCCAIKKSRQATEAALRDVRRSAHKQHSTTQPETIETAGYVMVFTTLDRREMSPTAALDLYRGRWQIELVFKRLKSLLGFGHLRKTDPASANAWLHGKLLVALLIESMIRHGESFSPWGYHLEEGVVSE